MKKLYALVTVAALSLTLGITAIAQGKSADKTAKKTGCSSCNKACATPEQMKKFKADSLDLRQEMMNKRFDLQREELKETPDAAKVAAIKADIEAIKAKIDALKTAANLPTSATCCMEDCPLMDDNCGNRQGCNCTTCNCKNCQNGKACAKTAKTVKNCAKCNKAADSGCRNCNKGAAACDKCGKAAQK